MCDSCGCGENGSQAGMPAPQEHHHHHDHSHSHGRESRKIELERSVLAKNNQIAEETHAWLNARGVCAINLISSPGTGKTTLLERTLERLEGRVSSGVIVGDQQTDNDAKRLSGKGAEVRQIETGNTCHLDAERVGAFVPEVVTDGVKLLIIENIGNLICPAAFALGEHHKIALLSVTEGEDKPLKYPALFSKASLVVLTKCDLIPHLDWDKAACLENIRKVAPEAQVIELSAKTGEGMDEWIEWLEEKGGGGR